MPAPEPCPLHLGHSVQLIKMSSDLRDPRWSGWDPHWSGWEAGTRGLEESTKYTLF